MPWQLINEKTEIDTELITCAEYQLFIDEQLKTSEYRHPLHWKFPRFSHGSAKKAIAGIKASDAQAFCNWLTQKYPLFGFKYRLPTTTEIEKFPSSDSDIGYWCTDSTKIVISGITQEQRENWQRNFLKVINRSCTLDFVRTLLFYFDLVCQCDINLILILDRALILSHDQLRDYGVVRRFRDLALNLARELVQNHNVISNLDFELNKEPIFEDDEIFKKITNISHHLERDLVSNTDFLLDLDLVRNIDFSDRPLLSLNIDLAHQIVCSREQNLRSLRYLAHILIRNLSADLTKTTNSLSRVNSGFLPSIDLNFEQIKELAQQVDQALGAVRHLKNPRLLNIEQAMKDACYFIEEQDFSRIRYCLLLIAGSWHWLSDIYVSFSNSEIKNLNRQDYQNLSKEYAKKKIEVLEIYSCFVLLEERQLKRLPALEGLRLVRERED